MKQAVLNNRKVYMMAIAVYQVVGGISGLWLIYRQVSPGVNAGVYIVMLPILALVLCSLFAGLFYFFKGECGKFFLLSKLNFCAQILQLLFGVKSPQFSISLGNVDYHFFNLNLFPILPLIMLRWAERNPAKDPAETFLTEDEPVQ